MLDLWGRTGWERGVLGYPTSSVAATTDGQGLYARFQGGSVYWSRATGAHAILAKNADPNAPLPL